MESFMSWSQRLGENCSRGLLMRGVSFASNSVAMTSDLPREAWIIRPRYGTWTLGGLSAFLSDRPRRC